MTIASGRNCFAAAATSDRWTVIVFGLRTRRVTFWAMLLQAIDETFRSNSSLFLIACSSP